MFTAEAASNEEVGWTRFFRTSESKMVEGIRLAERLAQGNPEGSIMIDDDEELAITQKQLALVEGIVESWRQELLPHNPKNFAIYAEGAIEQAEILRAEINEYLGNA